MDQLTKYSWLLDGTEQETPGRTRVVVSNLQAGGVAAEVCSAGGRRRRKRVPHGD